ncbi:hypothetical protein AFAEC_0565 [Aliarcobacter faecis]|uniref:terminase gpA endonuclease subunit n=1 Tax=Aliarcobacter faecis TaxID=1564138 RepID=UPI00047C4B09|nr:terminase gpA endonuclease subunit [Aliarcobacter faecis]QKF72756.1 hypothetical protein AFAEC_0565 [Aliarcobacter faecis]
MILRTCGVDVFDWGIEYLIVDWTDESISKIVASGKINGDFESKDFQKILKKMLKIFKVDVTTIDSGGHKTEYVYTFCEKYKKIFAIKGVCPSSDKIVDSVTTVRQNLKLYMVAFRNAKRRLVDINKVEIEVNDIFALAVISKEIASLK